MSRGHRRVLLKHDEASLALHSRPYGSANPSPCIPFHTCACRPTARALLVDMEPKAVAAAQQAAAGSGTWQYSRVAALARQPGSGNNWAAGALGHAPAVQQPVLGMLRRQAERCDHLGGFMVMQASRSGCSSAAAAGVVPLRWAARLCRCSPRQLSAAPSCKLNVPCWPDRSRRAWRAAPALGWAARSWLLCGMSTAPPAAS